MENREITGEDIDALLAFLPALSIPGREFGKWVGGGTKDGAIQMPGLSYDEDVEQFRLPLLAEGRDSHRVSRRDAVRQRERQR